MTALIIIASSRAAWSGLVVLLVMSIALAIFAQEQRRKWK